MKILDWYIIKKFLTTFIFTILLITIIAVAIDTSEKADDFVKSGLSSWQIFTHYYLGFIPFLVGMIFPLMVFIATIYFSSKMAGRSEFIAILANGVRYNRMLRPYIICSVFLALVFWIANRFWIPKANEIKSNFQATYIDRNSSYNPDPFKNNNYYLRVDANTFVGMRSYDTMTKSAYGFFLDKIKGNKVYYSVRSERISWDTAKKNWRLDNALERNIDSIHETVKLTPVVHLDLKLQPSELRRDEYLKDKLTSPELSEFIKREEERGSEGLNPYKVERYRRDATSFSVIIMTMIGAIVSTRKIRGGSGIHLAFGLVVAAVFVVMDKFSITFSTKGHLPPIIAVWIPNIIFSTIAIIIYRRTPK